VRRPGLARRWPELGRRRLGPARRWPDLRVATAELGAVAAAELGVVADGARELGAGQSCGWGRERRECGGGKTELQVGQAGRAGCPRVGAVCPFDPNVNHIWGRNGSGADRLSVWVAPLGAVLSFFCLRGHVRTAGGRMGSSAGDALNNPQGISNGRPDANGQTF
jgi:hypothetical protein